MHTNITIENITEKYVPLHISYKGNNTILYVARINNSIIVNINSLKIPGYAHRIEAANHLNFLSI